MMSQQDFNHNIEKATIALDQIIWVRRLLTMAIETTSTYTEENFDRVSVLLEVFEMRLDSEIDEMQHSLEMLQRHSFDGSKTLTPK